MSNPTTAEVEAARLVADVIAETGLRIPEAWQALANDDPGGALAIATMRYGVWHAHRARCDVCR